MSNSNAMAASVVGPEGRHVPRSINTLERPTCKGRGIENTDGNPSVSNPSGFELVRLIFEKAEKIEDPPMQRAAMWASQAPRDDLKAFIIAAYRALPFEDRVRFLNYVGGGGRGQ